MSPTGAIIFDMDGVLTDSEWFIAEAGRLMFWETHRVEITHGDFKDFMGMGENRFLGGVAEKYRIPGFEIERDKERTYAIYVDLIKGKLKPMPGAVEFVRSCKDQACKGQACKDQACEGRTSEGGAPAALKIAVATSTDYIKMMANLEAIGLAQGVFDALVNGLEVERRKPFPDLFLEAAKRLGVEPGRCWVVEDSVSGVAAAKAAGMRCLGLTTTTTAEAIRSRGADLVVKDLSAVRVEDLL
jgi:beta-phosphoglucomutase-like phosphatase (HAD superfamily)